MRDIDVIDSELRLGNRVLEQHGCPVASPRPAPRKIDASASPHHRVLGHKKEVNR
jgi:hypothetical protein